MDGEADAWFDHEIADCAFADERLDKRLRRLLERMEGAMGESIPLACQDWANTKAAYRFFSNDRVSEEEILAGHFQSTRSGFAATSGPILVLQDTTELTYQRERPEQIGITYRINSGKDKADRFRMHTVCGLLMHSSLAVTLKGGASWHFGHQVLDAVEVQGNRRAQEEDQSDAGSHRTEGERALAGEYAPVHCAIWRPGQVHPCRRPRERHLRAFLHRP
jgi:hypothetical protein